MAVKIEQGTEALEKAIALATDRYAIEELATAADVVNHVHERARFGFDTTVVAFAGGTGAGKSSLFNAVLEGTYARAAATRPTTRAALAVSSAHATELLDYLEIKSRTLDPKLSDLFPSLVTWGRHSRTRGLVVVDLPDIDSEVEENRRIAHKLAQRVDVLIWVLDPQKYADAVVHEKYFQTMKAVAGSSIVVVNHIDEVPADQRDSLLADVKRVLKRDNYAPAQLIATSAVTGEGVVKVRSLIDTIVKTKSAMAQRIAGDIGAAATTVAEAVRRDGGSDIPKKQTSLDHVQSRLATSVGADVIARASGESYRMRGRKATSWPVLRILRSAKVDPLKRLHLLEQTSSAPMPATDEDAAPPVPTGVIASEAHRTAGSNAVTTYIRESTAPMPKLWALNVRTQLMGAADEFFNNVDSVFHGAHIRYGYRPAWWMFVNLLQWLAVLTAIGGGVWLLLWNFADLLKLQIPAPPAWGIFPLPTLLLAGGIVCGWLLSLLCIPLVNAGAKRRERRVYTTLVKALTSHAAATIRTPMEQELDRYREFLQAISTASRTEL